jgi:CheY-like chemotaxis protein
LVTDPQRLQQVLRNLLANAVKFTDSGSVRLRISRASGVDVAFEVVDTGIGIADDKLELVFEAFQQADGTTSRRFGGTGLGLSISLELARLLGGAISVSSQPGKGSTFVLTVPLELPYAKHSPREALEPVPLTPAPIMTMAVAERHETPSARRLEGSTVLIVDDDVRNVFALTSALEMHGIEVLYADNGADGVRLLAETPRVDMVLMDAMMPEQDGYETTRAIRRNPTFADLPVVFLTAKAMPGDRESALHAGASDYLTKPVDLDELLHTMSSWIGSGSGARAGATAQPAPARSIGAETAARTTEADA